MPIFPWEQWFFQLQSKDAAVQADYATFQTQQNDIKLKGSELQVKASQLRQMLTSNYALIIISNYASNSDADFDKWINEVNALSPPTPGVSNSQAFTYVTTVADLIGVASFLTAIYRGGTFVVKKYISRFKTTVRGNRVAPANETEVDDTVDELPDEATNVGITDQAGVQMSALDSITQQAVSNVASATATSPTALNETEGDVAADTTQTESEAAAATDAECISLADIGSVAGIFVTVGFDALASYFEGRQQLKDLNEQKALIGAALKTVDGFIKRMDEVTVTTEHSIEAQMILYSATLPALQQIVPFTATPTGSPEYSNVAEYLQSMTLATQTFGMLTTIKYQWAAFHQNNPTGTWSDFTMASTMLAPAWLTSTQLSALFHYMKTKLQVTV